MGWYQWIEQYPRSVPPEPRTEHPSWLCVSASCIVVFLHESINFDYPIAQCWIILQLADFEQREWILVFLFPSFHHYYCLIYTCVEVFFYCLGWLRYTFSFIHLNKIFILLNYKIMLVLLVFHSIASIEFSIKLTFIIQNLYNILKYIMQCLRQALSEPTTLQLPIK